MMKCLIVAMVFVFGQAMAQDGLERLDSAESYLSEGDYPRAAEELTKYIELKGPSPSPSDAGSLARAYFLLGESLFAMADYEESVPNFTKALEMENGLEIEDRAFALFLRGQAYGNLDRQEEARIDFIHAVDLGLVDRDPFVLLTLGVTSARLGNHQESIDQLTHFLEEIRGHFIDEVKGLFSFILANYYLAIGYFHTEDYEEAVENASLFLSNPLLITVTDEDRAKMRFIRGASYYHLGQRDGALADLEEAVEILGDFLTPEDLEQAQQILQILREGSSVLE